MSNVPSFSDISELIPEMLGNGKSVSFTPGGGSMLPTVREGDIVTITGAKRLRKNDIALYRRKNGKAVLHRVVAVGKNGYIMCGDAQYCYERGVCDSSVIGRVISISRNGKTVMTDSAGFRLRSSLTVGHIKLCRLGLRIKKRLKK